MTICKRISENKWVHSQTKSQVAGKVRPWQIVCGHFIQQDNHQFKCNLKYHVTEDRIDVADQHQTHHRHVIHRRNILRSGNIGMLHKQVEDLNDQYLWVMHFCRVLFIQGMQRRKNRKICQCKQPVRSGEYLRATCHFQLSTYIHPLRHRQIRTRKLFIQRYHNFALKGEIYRSFFPRSDQLYHHLS